MAMTEEEDEDVADEEEDDEGTLLMLLGLPPTEGVDLKQRTEMEPTPR